MIYWEGDGCWQPVKAQFSGWLAVPELSDYFGERCSQTAAWPFAASSLGLRWLRLGSVQASGQRPSWNLITLLCSTWLLPDKQGVVGLGRNDEMYLFFVTIMKSKHKYDEMNLPRGLPTDQKGRKQQKTSQASFNPFSGVHLHDFARRCSFR